MYILSWFFSLFTQNKKKSSSQVGNLVFLEYTIPILGFCLSPNQVNKLKSQF